MALARSGYFFEYYLKGKGSLQLAEASVFETGSNHWTQCDTWPPKKAQSQKMYFQPDGTRSPTAGLAISTASYISDPKNPVPYPENVHLDRTREYMCDDQRFASRRPDVLTFETPVFGQSMTVTGPVTADFWVKIDNVKKNGPKQLDADFIVKLVEKRLRESF